MRPAKKRRRPFLLALLLVALVVGIFASGGYQPQEMIIPVEGATPADWNHETFWYHPWGRSGVHKGIDIFARRGTHVIAATHGVVTFSGERPRGGKVVQVLGPKGRVHYYAHLDERSVQAGRWVRRGQPLGTVGTTGNAAGKPPHLHYAVVTLLPYPWLADDAPQGRLKAYYLDPGALLLGEDD